MKISTNDTICNFIMKNLSLYLPLLAFVVFFLGDSALSQTMPECQLPQFGTISVDPDIEVNGAGQNIDTIEFWIAPDSSESLMFASAKRNQLVEVWKYPFLGNEQTPITHSTFNNSQVNGLFIDQESDLLYVAIGKPSSTVSVFSLPDLNFIMNFNKSGVNYQSEPNLAILNLTNGNKNIYVSADYPVYIHNAVTGDYINQFSPTKGLETMAPDNYYQRLYIPDENNKTGIYVYNPDGTPYTDNGSNIFGSNDFQADAEGIIVYNCPLNNPVDNGEGFIVVSDQRLDKTDFEFYDRVTWNHLGKLNISGVSNTDGIASFPYPLPDYPLGIFAVLNDDRSVAIVGWDKIFAQIVPAIDVTPPELQNAVTINPTQVTLYFSEVLNSQSAQNGSNYNINNGISVISAVLNNNNRDVTLTTTEHNFNQQYTVTVNNVSDLAGNVISPNNNSANYELIDNPGSGFPVDLFGTPESEKTAMINLTIPGNVPEFVNYHITAYDPDHGGNDPPEGHTFINGNGPFELFPGATQANGDNQTRSFTFISPSQWWVNGNNELRFVRLYSTGFRIDTAYVTFDGVSDLQEEGNLPTEFSLDQNYPNPFNPGTKIKFTIPTQNIGEYVTLKVYNIIGNEIATLIDENLPAGSYVVDFSTANLSSGIYFYMLISGAFSLSRKMILLK